MHVKISLTILALLAAGCATTRPDFVVAPNGNDDNPGTADAPFATLERAKLAVREKIAAGLKRDLNVHIRNGKYVLTEPVVFGLEDSPRGRFKVRYYGVSEYMGPVFTSTVPIRNWQPAGPVPHLPEAARGRVYVADLPEGLGRFHTLYDGAKRLPRARTKGFFPVTPGKDMQINSRRTMLCPPGVVKDWPNAPDVELLTILSRPWAMNVLPLESIDVDRGSVTAAFDATYPLLRVRGEYYPEGTAWIENTFEGLERPGRWVVDRTRRKLYLWPDTPDGRPGESIGAPALTELIRIEGRIDYDGPTDIPARNIILDGLCFTGADRYTWTKDHVGRGLQHDWEMFDKPTAMVRLHSAEGCEIRNCYFGSSGAAAVRLDLYCRNNVVDRNTIEHVGGVGVLLVGYGPGTKDVNRDNVVTNNYIHNVGEVYWASPAIFVWQSGHNHIAHNHIHDTPYTGIVVSGRIIWNRSGRHECSATIRWPEVDRALGGSRGYPPYKVRQPFLHARDNVIAFNDIHDVMQVMLDGNGIYISGAGAGNVVRNNYVHDCPSPLMAAGIRCDDEQTDTVIDSNILYRIGGIGTCIAIKGVNDVTNNILALPTAPSHRGMLSLERGPVDGSVIQRNIFYADGKGRRAVYQGRTYYKMDVWLKDCDADYNLYFHADDPTWGSEHLRREQARGIEVHSLSADPQFYDIYGGDFRLKDSSPARKLGFRPIDTTKIGIQPQQSSQRSRTSRSERTGHCGD